VSVEEEELIIEVCGKWVVYFISYIKRALCSSNLGTI